MTDDYTANILLTAQYKVYEEILRYKNKGKTERVGAIASRGIATGPHAKYKHMKPIGSPNSSNKKHSKQTKDAMYTVEESVV